MLPRQDLPLHPELLPANVKDNIGHSGGLLNQDVNVGPVHDDDDEGGLCELRADIGDWIQVRAALPGVKEVTLIIREANNAMGCRPAEATDHKASNTKHLGPWVGQDMCICIF